MGVGLRRLPRPSRPRRRHSGTFDGALRQRCRWISRPVSVERAVFGPSRSAPAGAQNVPARARRLNMNRKSLVVLLTFAAFAAMAMFSSAAFAGEKPVKTSAPFTAQYGGGEYFGEANTLHCKGVHKTNSVKYPG